jgi:Flp pilus assembly protein TadG
MAGTASTIQFQMWKKKPQLTGLEHGTSLVEFALIFILLATMVLGIMSFAHAIYAYHFIDHAAKSATRWAAVNGAQCVNDGSCTAPVTCTAGSCTYCTTGCAAATAADIQNYVVSLAPPGIIAANVTAATTWPAQTTSPAACTTTNNGIGCTVQVTVSYPFQFDFPLIDAMVPAATTTTAPCTTAGICMKTTSQMVIAH